MEHELRAEYEREDLRSGSEQHRGAVTSWHMVRDGDTVAMCGRPLTPDAAALPAEEWAQTPQPLCHTCGALYLREVP